MVLYLDHAATSPLRPEAREAYLRASEIGGNASSVQSLGRKAKLTLEVARNDILGTVGGLGASGLIHEVLLVTLLLQVDDLDGTRLHRGTTGAGRRSRLSGAARRKCEREHGHTGRSYEVLVVP